MAPKELDYLIIGPAHPFRGGIAETQHELAKALLEQGYTVRLITFTKLYLAQPVRSATPEHHGHSRVQSRRCAPESGHPGEPPDAPSRWRGVGEDTNHPQAFWP